MEKIALSKEKKMTNDEKRKTQQLKKITPRFFSYWKKVFCSEFCEFLSFFLVRYYQGNSSTLISRSVEF